MDNLLEDVGSVTAMLVVPLLLLVLMQRRSWALRRAQEMAMRAQLPFASDEMCDRVAAAIRRRATWGMCAAIGALAVFVVIPSTARGSGDAPWLGFTLVLTAMTAGSAAYEVRHPLFTPQPGSKRSAHARRMRTSDYLGRPLAGLPRVLLAASIITGTTVLLVGEPDGRARVSLIVSMLVAVAVAVGTAALERRVLGTSRPSVDALELAWDDLFRGIALNTLRTAAALAAWVPLGAAVIVAVRVGSGTASDASWFLFAGIPVLQLTYLVAAGRLPAALYPDLSGRPA